MKYIGVDKDGEIWCFSKKPKWRERQDWMVEVWWGNRMIEMPPEILPPLEPCCLYKITKDAYVMIEDRRLK